MIIKDKINDEPTEEVIEKIILAITDSLDLREVYYKIRKFNGRK